MKLVLLFLVCTVLLIPAAADARSWLVRQDGSGDCTTIQACVDSATAGDTVLVSPGTYEERVEMKSGVVLTSEQGAAQTVIDAYGFGLTAVRMYMCDPSTVVKGFTITGARAIAPGGGVEMWNGVLSNNLIVDNYSTGIDVGGLGGGVTCYSGTITENTIVDNFLDDGYGAGIYCHGGAYTIIERNIIVGNTGGYGIYCEYGTASISCNSVWNNVPGNYGGSCPDQTGMNGNISVDPLFCDSQIRDYTLHADSPSLDAPGCGLIGAFAQGCPATSVEEYWTSWGRIKVLFR